MIFAQCINCDHMHLIEYRLGVMEKIKCDQCGTVQWLKHSNIDPVSYSEDMIEVDEVNKTVRIKEMELG